jgi:hypothetical protein
MSPTVSVSQPKKKKKNEYIDNKKFLEAIIARKEATKKAKEAGIETPPLTHYLGECILLIAQKMASRPEFNRYSFVNDMVLDAVENALQYFDNFDPEIIGPKSGIVTPFGYFSQITYFAFQRRILKEQKQRYIKCKVMENMVLTVDSAQFDGYNPYADTAFEFIEKYEEREKQKKIRREARKKENDNDKL